MAEIIDFKSRTEDARDKESGACRGRLRGVFAAVKNAMLVPTFKSITPVATAVLYAKEARHACRKDTTHLRISLAGVCLGCIDGGPRK
jgi:hypothetical protein